MEALKSCYIGEKNQTQQYAATSTECCVPLFVQIGQNNCAEFNKQIFRGCFYFCDFYKYTIKEKTFLYCQLCVKTQSSSCP